MMGKVYFAASYACLLVRKHLLGVYSSYHCNDFNGIALAACSVDGNEEIVPVARASPAIEEAEIGIGL
jgi:hypothetical protein